MRKIYPSDITQEDFEEIRLEMERDKPAQQDTASLGAERTREKAGVKIHIAKDVLGLPYTTAIPPANVTDRDGAALMLFFHRSISGKFMLLEKILVDGGYTGKTCTKGAKPRGSRSRGCEKKQASLFRRNPKKVDC